MTNTNKFWKGVLWGALAGGAVSLLDKQTRLAMKEHGCQTAEKISDMVRKPEKITNRVKEKTGQFKTMMKEVSEDISYISEKVKELRDTTPKVMEIVKETKETFKKNDDDHDHMRME